MKKIICLSVVIAVTIGLVNIARAELFDFTGPLDWTTSDSSVYTANGYLIISSNGVGNDSMAEKELSIELSPNYPVVINTRMKLVSGGLNYRLPRQIISFEDSSELEMIYLPSDIGLGQSYGWHFGGWTGIDEPSVPGSGWWSTATADYWTLIKIVFTPTGGELFMKPDDADKGWFSDEFYSITSKEWSHSSIEKIHFDQPWDSVNYIDYVSIVPEPATMILLFLGGIFLRKKCR